MAGTSAASKEKPKSVQLIKSVLNSIRYDLPGTLVQETLTVESVSWYAVIQRAPGTPKVIKFPRSLPKIRRDHHFPR